MLERVCETVERLDRARFEPIVACPREERLSRRLRTAGV